MAFWLRSLDPYISVLEPTSSRILAIILDKPGYQVSAHVAIYLPTAGKESEFVEELAALEATIDNIFEKYPSCCLYIRGDANSSTLLRPGNKRDDLFSFFMSNNSLQSIPINHTTYHHFMNGGSSDSCIDVILSSTVDASGDPNTQVESLLSIVCSKSCDLINSSHDLLITSLDLTSKPVNPPTLNTLVAPRVSDKKHKIVWSEEGVAKYQELLQHTLPSLQSDFSGTLLSSSASVLLQATNHILSAAAKYTNKSIDISAPRKPKSSSKPSELTAVEKLKKIAHKNLLHILGDPSATPEQIEAVTTAFKTAKSSYQNVVRRLQVHEECVRDQELNGLLGHGRALAMKMIKSGKKKNSSSIKSLKVGDKVYEDNNVGDGFYDSITKLKTLDTITSPNFDSFATDYQHIIEICKSARTIPRISRQYAGDLLRRIRASVADFYSITAGHYLNGGEAALDHFCFMFNAILGSIDVADTPELNTAHAVVLHKGHGKDKNLDTSYRIISSCPFLAKCVDIYLGELSKDDWKSCQATTQYQGEGMSHELAALLLTCTVQDSLLAGKPLFLLLLDAKSAFDRVLREILVRRLFLDTTRDQRILYWDLRLSSRQTFISWDGHLLGPIHDQRGVEQGVQTLPTTKKFTKIRSPETGLWVENFMLLLWDRLMTRRFAPTTSTGSSTS